MSWTGRREVERPPEGCSLPIVQIIDPNNPRLGIENHPGDGRKATLVKPYPHLEHSFVQSGYLQGQVDMTIAPIGRSAQATGSIDLIVTA